MEISVEFPQRTKNRITVYNRINSWIHIQRKVMSAYNRGTCTPMFIVALFTIAKLWNQTRCPSQMNGSRKCGISKKWTIFSATKKNDMSFARNRCNKRSLH
jgi:hypothetical protein